MQHQTKVLGRAAHKIEHETVNTPSFEINGDKPLVAHLIFGCVRTGDAIITLNITNTPIYQPYRPTLITMRKKCGGIRTGLHVYPSEKVVHSDIQTRPKPPINLQTGLSNAVLQDGRATLRHSRKTLPKKGKKGYSIIHGQERKTTFYVQLPIREIDESLGNVSLVKTPCRYDSSLLCRQLPLTNTSLPSITATCDPPICTSTYLGVGSSGPTVSGEIIGKYIEIELSFIVFFLFFYFWLFTRYFFILIFGLLVCWFFDC